MNVKRTLLAMGFALGSVAALAPASALADITVRFGPPPLRQEVVPVLPSGWVTPSTGSRFATMTSSAEPVKDTLRPYPRDPRRASPPGLGQGRSAA